MKKQKIILIAFVWAFAACTSAPKPTYPCPEAQPMRSKDTRTTTGRWIVWNKKSLTAPVGIAGLANFATVLSAAGAKKIEGINAFAFDKAPPTMPMLTGNDWVTQPEYVHHILNDQLYRIVPANCPSPGPAPGPGPAPEPVTPAKSWGVTRVRAMEAMKLVDTSNVKVCVIDTGIDQNHPNKGNVIGTASFAGNVQDGAGHGTHVAGTVAGTGGVGISRAKLLICKGLSDSGSGTSSALAQCLNWCGQQGANIVSNSWGSPQSDPLINQAIANLTAKGIYVFVANGNDSGPVNWPAKLAGQNSMVLAVAASDQTDRIANFSSRGPETKFISPGVGIISNWPGGATRPLDGTSMATPHAAAICAFGVARGIKPCIKTSGSVAGYPFADALTTAQ